MKKLNIRLTFTEPILGTLPNRDLYREQIVSKIPKDVIERIDTDEEESHIEVETERGITVFPRTDDGTPFLYDYQIKGFFKGACGFLRRVNATLSSKITSYKKEIDGLIFVYPREIVFQNYGEITEFQRPLRASTPQGERISIAISEKIPAGAYVDCTIRILDEARELAILEWLDYGAMSGIGQWRNASYGRFNWDLVDEDGNILDKDTERQVAQKAAKAKTEAKKKAKEK